MGRRLDVAMAIIATSQSSFQPKIICYKLLLAAVDFTGAAALVLSSVMLDAGPFHSLTFHLHVQ